MVDMLKEQEMTLSLAESCTGGAIAARIVNVSGASEVFLQGMVTYSNKAKRRCLDVSKSTLKKHGAVSEECAAEMAKGGRKAAETDICLSVTGIAGPGGGTKEKPVQDSARESVISCSFSISTTASSRVLDSSVAKTFLPNLAFSSLTTGLMSF